MAPRELILSDITRMGEGLCVIGIERAGSGYRSVRPGPPRGHAWPPEFPYRRGDHVQFELSAVPVAPPHLEDHHSTGPLGKSGHIPEADLVACLRQAEMAGKLKELFGCPVHVKRKGAHIWPTHAVRSICGVDRPRVRVRMEAGQIRAAVGLPSGESLPDLPVVDRSWHAFGKEAFQGMAGANKLQRLNRFISARLLESSEEQLFVRIGVTRQRPRQCWLMVDSLFPAPKRSWLNDLLAAGAGLGTEAL